jgi:hypothetical protein
MANHCLQSPASTSIIFRGGGEPPFVVYTLSAFITLRWWLFLTGALAASVSTVFLLLIGSYASS